MDIGYFTEQAIKSARMSQRQAAFALKVGWICTATEFVREAREDNESEEGIWQALEAIGDACRRPPLARMGKLHEGSEVMEWRPIETAPKDKTAVLVWSPSTHKVVRPARFWEYADQWIDEQSDKVLRPTHWMPLPEPPKDTAWIDQAAAHDFNDES